MDRRNPRLQISHNSREGNFASWKLVTPGFFANASSSSLLCVQTAKPVVTNKQITHMVSC